MDLTKLNVAIVTHEYFKGSAQELRDFLVKLKIPRVFYVANMFSYAKNSASYCEDYAEGVLKSKKESGNWPKNEFIMCFRDLIYTFYFFFTTKGKFDLYVGSDSFNTILGLVLRALGKVDKVVFFTIDYIMNDRFSNPILNWIYVKMDRIAFFGSDYTWNVSDRMSRQRVIELGDPAKKKIQLEVQIGVSVGDAQKIQVNRKDNILVYSGSLREGFGLFKVVESIPILLRSFSDLELRIIGEGPIGDELKKRVRDLGVEKNVNFVGFIDTTKERTRWLRLLKESTLGLAIYDETETTYKQFSDVTKPKDYMAVGLPIITTSVIPISEKVKSHNLGSVVEDSVESIAKGIRELLENTDKRHETEKNIREFRKNITWDSIFKKVFNKMEIKC